MKPITKRTLLALLATLALGLLLAGCGGGSNGDEWAADFLDANTALRISDTGGYSGGTINGATQGLAKYRCVASPSG